MKSLALPRRFFELNDVDSVSGEHNLTVSVEKLDQHIETGARVQALRRDISTKSSGPTWSPAFVGAPA